MSLDHKPTGNPNWKPGFVANPQGRPKGTLANAPKVKDRLLKKWKTHPVDKLVELANFVKTSDPELAAKIWTDLLKYFEPTKKPVEVVPEKTTPEESVDAANETYKLLEELENGGLSQTTSGEGNGVETRPIALHPTPSPETDLQEHQGE